MAQKIIKNRAASNRAKLLNIARLEKIDFDGLLLRFMQERLLHRLSLSKYKYRFVLKGGLLLACYDLPFLRATKDIDLLAKEVDSRPDLMKKMFTDILKRPYDDGVTFDITSIAAENIKKGSDYVSIRIRLKAKLEQAVKTIQIDVGFGDVIIPKPLTMTFPTILEEEAPRIGVYSKESIISEKFEAMIKLSTINSRFKDFFDIYALSEAYSFDGHVLKAAVEATFKQRKTMLPSRPLIFGPSFAKDNNRQKQWRAFLRKSKMVITMDFETVIAKIATFLRPVVTAITTKQEIASHWDHAQKNWT